MKKIGKVFSIGMIGISIFLPKIFENSLNNVQNYGFKQQIIKEYDVVDLSTLAIDPIKFSEITSNYESGRFSFWQIKPQLEEEIFNQLDTEENYYLQEGEVLIDWNIEDEEFIDTGELISFDININPDVWDPFAINSLHVEFESWAYSDLGDILEISSYELQEITKQYESGSKFSKIENSLESYLDVRLEEELIPVEFIEYEWNFSKDENVYTGDKINYKIYSNNPSLKNEISGSFVSKEYENLDDFEIDINPLNEIVNSNKNTKFSSFKNELEEELKNQLSNQYFNTEYLNIIWNLDDEQFVEDGDEIEFNIYSLNSTAVIGSYSNAIICGNSIHGSNNNLLNTVGIIIFSILLILLLLGIILIGFKYFNKNNKNKKNFQKKQQNFENNERIKEIKGE